MSGFLSFQPTILGRERQECWPKKTYDWRIRVLLVLLAQEKASLPEEYGKDAANKIFFFVNSFCLNPITGLTDRNRWLPDLERD
jgi:hypothetical protein